MQNEKSDFYEYSVTCNLNNCHSALDTESKTPTILDSRFRGNDSLSIRLLQSASRI